MLRTLVRCHVDLKCLLSPVFQHKDSRLVQTNLYSTDKFDLIWPIQQITMNTGGGTLSQNQTGANFYVGYIDTDMSERNGKVNTDMSERNGKVNTDKPRRTIVYLGNEHHLDDVKIHSMLQKNLFKPLVENNCRIVMPFLVGSKNTRGISKEDEVCFDYQMIGERSRFALDFLIAKRIKEVDLIVGHSMGCFPAMSLILSCEKLKRLALLCPIPGNEAPKWIRPPIISFMMIDYYHNIFLYPFVRLWLRRVRRLMGQLLVERVTNDQVAHLIRIAHGMHYTVVRSMARTLVTLHTPLLYVTCTGDEAVDHTLEKEYMDLIGLKESDFNQYDEGYDITRARVRVTKPSLMRGVALPNDHHLPFMNEKSSNVIVQEILELLETNSDRLPSSKHLPIRS